MAHLTVGMRLEGTKGSIVKAMEYMQMHGIKFIQSKGFYGEDEGKEKSKSIYNGSDRLPARRR